MSQPESTLPTWDTETGEAESVAPVATEPAASSLVADLEAPPPQEPAAPQSETESPPAEPAAPEASLASEGEKPSVVEKPTEAESEDVVDEPPEVKAVLEALTIPEARKAAKQWRKDAAPVRDFLNYSQPITNLGTALYELSPSRYTEHVFDLLEKHSKEIFGATFTEVKERLNGTAITPSAPAPKPAQDSVQNTVQPVELSDSELDALSNDQLRQRIGQLTEAAATKAKQEVESQLNSRIDDLTTRLNEVTGKVESHQTTEQQREINTKSQELYDRVWSVVPDGIRELGLEAKADDPPRIAALKSSARKLLNAQAIDDAFTANDQNTQIMKSVKGAMERREFANAFREEDNLKVRLRAALNSLATSTEVKAILDEIAASAQSSAPPPATNPAPPVPGSTAGVQLKPPTTWDEAEQMGAVATA